MSTYEQLLNLRPGWALNEGGMHFEGQSAVHRALHKLTRRLEALGIPYAVAGGMALFLHGYRRFTEDVDVLVTPEGLLELHKHLDGLGYLPPFPGSRNLRDGELGVRIEFLVSGQFPGEGRPGPIPFPLPQDASVEIAGVRCLRLERLIELKLASSRAPGRRRDLGDVQELIRTLGLPETVADHLDESVRAVYQELWAELQAAVADPWDSPAAGRSGDAPPLDGS